MARAPALTSELLDDLVERVVEAVHPRRIILFGSGARGDLGPNSDLDLLIVMTDGTHRRQTEGGSTGSCRVWESRKTLWSSRNRTCASSRTNHPW